MVDDLESSADRVYGRMHNMSWIVDHAGIVAYKAAWTAQPMTVLKRASDRA